MYEDYRLSEDLIARLKSLEAWKEDVETRETLPKRLGNMIAFHLGLPGLRGFWPFSSFDSASLAQDLSGQGRHLTRSGATYNYIAPIPTILLQSNQSRHFSRADEAGLDITGTESVVSTSWRGLTLGIWVRPTSAGIGTGLTQHYIGKWHTPSNRSYTIVKNSNDTVGFSVSNAGTANDCAATTSFTLEANKWYHLVGRFTPSTGVDLFVNGVKTAYNSGSPPASIFSGTADLNIGASQNGTASFADCYASMAFLCAMQLSDAYVIPLHNHSRRLFGV